MPNRAWPVVYEVIVTPVTGATNTYQVVTWLGPEKAIAMAVQADGRGYGTDKGIYDASVQEVGRAPASDDGTVSVAGYLFDRMEF